MVDNINKRWKLCLDYIYDKNVKTETRKRWFRTWFGDISLERYDEQSHTIIVRVPSKYVYECLETYARKTFYEALLATFEGVQRIQYRILPPAPSFEEMASRLQQQLGGVGWVANHIHVDGARKRFEEGLRSVLKKKGKEMQWLKGYDRIVRFLDDNDNRGLLVVGTPGLGKSLVCQKVIPAILYDGKHPISCVSAMKLKDRLEELKKERIVVIDDLGKEPRRYYGDVDNSFLELCANAEETGQILIITTNLSTFPIKRACYPDSILNRYGEAVISRLQAITHVAIVEGEDMRHEPTM